MKFYENYSIVSRVVPRGQTDGRLEDMTKLKLAFRSFANAPKNEFLSRREGS
jgi:hypothetical protein